MLDRFLEIESGLYMDVVHFYEDHRDKMYQQDMRDTFIMQVCYLEALFEIGKYREVLIQVDDAIERAIMYDFSSIHGVDMYVNLLFKKATSLYHLHRTDEAMHLTRQLLSIYPNDRTIRIFYKTLLMKVHRRMVLPTRVFFISGLLSTAILMIIEMIMSWFLSHGEYVIISGIRNYIFLCSIGVFIMGETFRWFYMEYKAWQDFSHLKKEKSQRIRQRAE